MKCYKISESKKTILSSLLLAIFIILDRLLTINTQFVVLNLSLVPIMVAGMILGWKYAMLIGILGDFIGAILWPFGEYFLGFTISVGLSGLVFGLFLYETPNKPKKHFKIKAIFSTLIVTIVINLLLNSLWLNIMYGKAYMYYLGIRVLAQVITFPLYIGTIIILEKTLKKPIKKYLYKEEQ